MCSSVISPVVRPSKTGKENDVLAPSKLGFFPAGEAALTAAQQGKVLHDFSALTGTLIEVEGNIASGKSTLTKRLRDHFVTRSEGAVSSSVFAEQTNQDFLGAFYSDSKKYAFAFQMYMLTTRLYQLEEASRRALKEDAIAFLDRGVAGDSLFAMLNHEMGNMGSEEFGLYQSVCRERLPQSLGDKVDLVLYLDVSPQECHRRLLSVRKHAAEASVPLSYLDAVDRKYFELVVEWLGRRNNGVFNGFSVGDCPPVAIMRWENYGTTQQAITALCDLKNGKTQSPTVVFVDSLVGNGERSPELALDSEEEVEAAYSRLQMDGCPAGSAQRRGRVVGCKRVLHARWTLPHNNAFRRVVMFYLSVGGEVVFER